MMQIMQLPAQAAQIEITESLVEAITEASKMSVEDQNYIAFRIMEEMDSDDLAVMLRNAEEEYKRGDTKLMSKNCVVSHD